MRRENGLQPGDRGIVNPQVGAGETAELERPAGLAAELASLRRGAGAVDFQDEGLHGAPPLSWASPGHRKEARKRTISHDDSGFPGR